MKFSQFAELNPRTILKRNEKYKFVPMEDLTPGRRYVTPQTTREYKGGGAKFQTNDVLFARITPCLENGKIAQFKAPENTLGFGSTEFFVFRSIEDISDSSYLFYLATS